MQIRKTVVETPNTAPVSIIWDQNKPTPPALPPAAHTASLSGSGGPCGNPTVLAYPVSWSLQCRPAFPTTAHALACQALSAATPTLSCGVRPQLLLTAPSPAPLPSKPGPRGHHLRPCQILLPVPTKPDLPGPELYPVVCANREETLPKTAVFKEQGTISIQALFL